MMVESAQYGDFDTGGIFNQNANIDTKCSKLTNCRLKSLCGGQRSCKLTMDNNLLSSKYCFDTSKQIYTKYTCVDTYNSSTITAGNVWQTVSLILIMFVDLEVYTVYMANDRRFRLR